MRKRTRPRNSTVERLRLAIDCMPAATREAMLAGVRANERIIVGAYVDGQGGVCPMLAAHRCGGRTDFLSFAKSWDRFARSDGRARAASARELRILISQLEASLQCASATDFDRAIAEHRDLVSRGGRGGRLRRTLSEVVDPAGEIRARRMRSRARRLVPDDLAARAVHGAVSAVPASG
jgi:hypothetical protein